MEEHIMTVAPPMEKRKKGCLFYGCLTIAILSLAVLIGGGVGMYFLYQKAEAFVDQWGSPEPMELPEVRYTDTEMEQFEERLRIFSEGLAEGKPTVPLTLKGEDLNMLLASSDGLERVSKGIRARVEGDQVKGQVSLKLGDLGAPFFKDRYMNGEVAFKVSLAEGQLIVHVTEVVVNGEALPEEYLAPLKKENLAQGVTQNPELTETLKKLESIDVDNNVIRVVPKPSE
jgi:hypothetical protein